ncbi:MAG: hypothetical protein JSW40_05300, partial [Candidatus Omnitrophota bacterium]
LILKASNELAEAVKLCQKIEKNFSGTHVRRIAKILRSGIEMPTLSLQAKTVMPPANEAFTITTKNLKKVYFHIYQVNPQQLKDEFIS